MTWIYDDKIRKDILGMIPDDGQVIGSFGCGKAGTEYELVKAGRQVHGVDISEDAIKVAEIRLSSARLIPVGTFDCFAPQSLDGLILADVLEHLYLAKIGLKQMAGWVRPGGWIVISVPNMRSYRVLWQFVILGDWPEERAGIFDETHIQAMSKRRLKRWCIEADLEPEKWFTRYPPFPLWRRVLFQFAGAVSLGLMTEWLQYQVQVRCRTRKGT